MSSKVASLTSFLKESSKHERKMVFQHKKINKVREW